MCHVHYTRSVVLSFYASIVSFKLKFYTLVGYISYYMLIFSEFFLKLEITIFDFFKKMGSMELELQKSTLISLGYTTTDYQRGNRSPTPTNTRNLELTPG
jgi:hypothetical protein